MSKLKGALGDLVDFDAEDFDAEDFTVPGVDTFTKRYQLRGLPSAGKLRGVDSGKLRGLKL